MSKNNDDANVIYNHIVKHNNQKEEKIRYLKKETREIEEELSDNRNFI